MSKSSRKFSKTRSRSKQLNKFKKYFMNWTDLQANFKNRVKLTLQNLGLQPSEKNVNHFIYYVHKYRHVPDGGPVQELSVQYKDEDFIQEEEAKVEDTNSFKYVAPELEGISGVKKIVSEEEQSFGGEMIAPDHMDSDRVIEIPLKSRNSDAFDAREANSNLILKDSKDLQDIEFEELREKLKNNEIILIDCRTEKEITKTGIIPKAVNIPLDCLGDVIMLPEKKFEEAIAIKKPSQEANIVTMCLAGIRARTAQFALMGAGYHNVRQYRGSFRDWISNDGPVEFRSSNDA